MRIGRPFRLSPQGISAVALTQAHLDHCGYLPVLVKGGVRDDILCSEATADLCEILLRDAGHLQENDAHLQIAKSPWLFAPQASSSPLYCRECRSCAPAAIGRSVSSESTIARRRSASAIATGPKEARGVGRLELLKGIPAIIRA